MRRPLALAAALLLAAGPACARKPQPAPPVPLTEQGLVDDVDGYSFGPDGAVTRFTGLLIDRQGRIARLLGPDDPRPERPDFRFDAHGRTLLPGLIDADVRLSAIGFQASGLDLGATASLAAAQQALGRYARAHETPGWIRGGGWDEVRWGLGRDPAAADLDAAVKARPVMLVRAGGDALLANSAAIAEAGITAKTVDPPGGRIVRDARGTPTGLFIGSAMGLIERAAPARLPKERDAAIVAAQRLMLRAGITTVCDIGTDVADWESIRRLGDRGGLRLRVIAYAAGLEPLLAIAGPGPTPWLYDGRLRMVGLGLAADGDLGARAAWLTAPYADAAPWRGMPRIDDAKLRNLMVRAAMDDFQVAVEANGDAAVHQMLGAIDDISDAYGGDRRWRIEGAGLVAPADLDRLKAHSLVLVMQAPADPAAGARLSWPRAASLDAAMARDGVPLALGSGSGGGSPNAFAALADAARHLPLARAFAAFTAGGAYAARAEDRLGSLAPGHLADFILVDRDPFRVDAATLGETQILETWIGGVRAWVRP